MPWQTVAGDLEIRPLVLQGIGKHFGRKAVLQGIDLDIPGGQVVGILGPNGAGKTTLLSIAAGLMAPDRGERRLGGRAMADLALEARAHLALVTHSAQLYPLLTARENLELCVDLRRAGGFDSLPWQDLARRLGLADAVEQRVSTYSRGMMQRLALARALVGRPQVLLLDEPFTALDRGGRALLTDVLREQARAGVAVLLSSHDFEAVLQATDRAVWLEGGRLVAEIRREAMAGDRPDGAGSPGADDYRARLLAVANASSARHRAP